MSNTSVSDSTARATVGYQQALRRLNGWFELSERAEQMQRLAEQQTQAVGTVAKVRQAFATQPYQHDQAVKSLIYALRQSPQDPALIALCVERGLQLLGEEQADQALDVLNTGIDYGRNPLPALLRQLRDVALLLAAKTPGDVQRTALRLDNGTILPELRQSVLKALRVFWEQDLNNGSSRQLADLDHLIEQLDQHYYTSTVQRFIQRESDQKIRTIASYLEKARLYLDQDTLADNEAARSYIQQSQRDIESLQSPLADVVQEQIQRLNQDIQNLEQKSYDKQRHIQFRELQQQIEQIRNLWKRLPDKDQPSLGQRLDQAEQRYNSLRENIRTLGIESLALQVDQDLMTLQEIRSDLKIFQQNVDQIKKHIQAARILDGADRFSLAAVALDMCARLKQEFPGRINIDGLQAEAQQLAGQAPHVLRLSVDQIADRVVEKLPDTARMPADQLAETLLRKLPDTARMPADQLIQRLLETQAKTSPPIDSAQIVQQVAREVRTVLSARDSSESIQQLSQKIVNEQAQLKQQINAMEQRIDRSLEKIKRDRDQSGRAGLPSWLLFAPPLLGLILGLLIPLGVWRSGLIGPSATPAHIVAVPTLVPTLGLTSVRGPTLAATAPPAPTVVTAPTAAGATRPVSTAAPAPTTSPPEVPVLSPAIKDTNEPSLTLSTLPITIALESPNLGEMQALTWIAGENVHIPITNTRKMSETRTLVMLPANLVGFKPIPFDSNALTDLVFRNKTGSITFKIKIGGVVVRVAGTSRENLKPSLFDDSTPKQMKKFKNKAITLRPGDKVQIKGAKDDFYYVEVLTNDDRTAQDAKPEDWTGWVYRAVVDGP